MATQVQNQKALKLVAARVCQLRKEQTLKDRNATRYSLMGGSLMGGGD
jgi:protein subunit release factor A